MEIVSWLGGRRAARAELTAKRLAILQAAGGHAGGEGHALGTGSSPVQPGDADII